VSRRINATGHPARFSAEIVDLYASILDGMFPDPMGRPMLWDPFAGTGEMLARIAELTAVEGWGEVGFDYGGTELEAAYIRAEYIVHGDATDRDTYLTPRSAPCGWVVVTSPAYGNGVSDNHKPRDLSTRKTYRASLIKLTGDPDYELHPNNMGGHGYRGTLRAGRSKRRVRYWEVADAAVACWDTAHAVLVNVSDFKHSNGEVEPLVDDWRALLERHGWADQTVVPVGTSRMRHGANHDQRVDNEVIIIGRKPL
jgi:hypothetical protein